MKKSDIRNNDVVIVATFAHDWMAHLAQGYLENHGIRSMLSNKTFNAIYPFPFSNAWTNINLWVSQAEAAEARRILDEFDPASVDNE